jgi:hypothetical protein
MEGERAVVGVDIASFALRNSRAQGGRPWIRGVGASIPRSVLVLGLTVAAFAPANDALAAESRPEPGIVQGDPLAPQSPVPEPTAPTDAATPPGDATPDPAGDPVAEGSASAEDEANPPAAVVDGAQTPETETSEAPGEGKGPSEQQSGAPTSGAGTPVTEGTPPADDTVAASEPPGPAEQAASPTPDNGASAETSTQGERGETSAKAPPAPAPTEEPPAAAGSGPRSEGLVATVQNDGATGELAAQEAISAGALLTPLGSTFLYTAVGGESRTSSAVSRLRTKRTARVARVMAPPKKFPHRRVPPAPGVAAGVGGAPANSSSGIRHLAAFAPGFVLAGPDRAGRPLSRDATEGPAAFVSLIERPG